MKIPNPRRYRRLLAARRERARRNQKRKLRREIATCERLLNEIAVKRHAATGEERRLLAREWMRALVKVAKLDVELALVP